MEQVSPFFHTQEVRRLEPITAAKLLLCNEINGRDHMVLLKCAVYGDRPMRSGTNDWDLPGGKADDGESSQDAALREAKEELGNEMASTLSVAGLCRVKSITTPKFSAGLSITRDYYTARTDYTNFTTDTEHDGGFWCPLPELFDYVTNEPDVEAIEYVKRYGLWPAR